VCRSVLASPELGATVRAAFEYEFRLYDIESGRPASPAASYSQRLLGELDGFIKDVAQSTAAWRVELEAVHTEAAPGLMEVSVGACDGLEAADVAIALRSCIREAARRHGLRAGFAAKPVTGEEGSGGHLHISLGDPDGRNLFACDALADKPLPAVMRHAIAGLLAHLGSMSALYNPYHNSYKRLIPGWFAPVRADWAIDDRDAAVRVVAGDQPQTTHLELRRPGADANPYLVLAAAVVSIAEGLQQELELPPDASCGAPPTDLRLALVAFAADARARERLGERFCEYWGISREWELSAFNDVITPWELARAGELMHR
jgi:glutamine synthetase